MATRGISPRQADELFIWECAVLLGVHHKEQAVDTDPHAHLRARVEGVEFEWAEPTPAEIEEQMALMQALAQ